MSSYISRKKIKTVHITSHSKGKHPVSRVNCAVYHIHCNKSQPLISCKLRACVEHFTQVTRWHLLSSKCLGKQHDLPFQQWAGMPALARPPQVAQLKPQQGHHVAHNNPAPLAHTCITAGTQWHWHYRGCVIQYLDIEPSIKWYTNIIYDIILADQ